MQRAATSDIFAARVLPFLGYALTNDDPNSPRRLALDAMDSWVVRGAPLVSVTSANGTDRVIPYPGAAIYTDFRTAAPTRWPMPELLETYRGLGLIGPVFGQTVMERENRGSFNIVAELGHPIRSEIIVPPGESGTFTAADIGHEPPHLRDQLRPYE